MGQGEVGGCMLALPHDSIRRQETFRFVMSLPAMSFGDTFCMSRKGGTGRGWWV